MAKENFNKLYLYINSLYPNVSHIKTAYNGDWSTVFLIETNKNRKYAFKIASATTDSAIETLAQEAKVLESMQGSYVPKIYDIRNCKTVKSSDKEEIYPTDYPSILMEYIAGKAVDLALKRASYSTKIGIFKKICKAVQKLHEKNFLHLDLKPSNFLVTPENELKFIDFGTCVSKYHPQQSRGLGTTYFKAPEVILHEKPSSKTDIFSLGVIFYYILTSKMPFCEVVAPPNITSKIAKYIAECTLNVEPAPIAKFQSKIPTRIQELVLSMLEKDPNNRPSNTIEVREGFNK